MRQISGKELCRIVEQRGWVHRRTTGSHFIYGKTGESVRLSIPKHGNRPLGVGLLRTLLKQAGIDPDTL